MKRQDFENRLATLQELELRVNRSKGVEYAGVDDALMNFKEDGEDLGLPARQILAVHLNKHLKAIRYYLRTGETLSEDIHGRILDARLYLALLDALIVETEIVNTTTK
jgi:hypothetical protein